MYQVITNLLWVVLWAILFASALFEIGWPWNIILLAIMLWTFLMICGREQRR